MVKASSKYSDEVLRMADLMLDLDMTNKSKSELLDTLHNMENNDQRGYIELQSNIAAEQSDRYKMKREAEKRSEKRRMDRKEKDRTKKRLESFRKDSKGKAAMVGGLSRTMNRGGLSKSGSMDYRKKGLFY